MKPIACALLGLLTASAAFPQQVGVVDLTRPIGVLALAEQSGAPLCKCNPALGFWDDPAASVATSEIAAADQLFRAGKLPKAEAAYHAILQKDPNSIPAEVGFVRSMLRQQKVDESFDEITQATAAHPNSASLLAVKGEVQFRLAKMSDAELSYLKAKSIDPNEVRVYLGLEKLYAAESLYRQAYDQLQTAHAIAPDDVEVQRAWLGMLPRKERLTALEAYLSGPHPEDEEETQWMRDYLDFLKATVDKPVHECKLVSKVPQTQAKLKVMYGEDGRRMSGIGLSVQLNDHRSRLLLDTATGGIIVSRRVAEKAGLIRVASMHFPFNIDKGPQTGYRAVADHIRVGELEFQDCVILVSDRHAVRKEDGVIGADVFGAYLVNIDLPAMQLRLSPLPKRPEDTVAPTSLNCEEEEQANAEQKEETKPAQRLPKDRYIAPEMANWTKVFRFEQMMLAPTFVNDSPSMLFAIDTGAFDNFLSGTWRAARGQTKFRKPAATWDPNGKVSDVSARTTLRVAHVQQPSMDISWSDLSKESRLIGIELSGLLGLSMLRMFEVKLDYRDGLVEFDYDPKHPPAFVK